MSCFSLTSRVARTLVAFAMGGLLFGKAAVASAQAPSDLMIILDVSGSMWGQVKGENKIVIARRVLRDVVGKLPASTPVGLVVYGHRRESDCADIETLVARGSTDRAALLAKVDKLTPKGKTPITGSILHTLKDIQGSEQPATVILISDGLETCDGDPCKTVREARAAGAKVIMHVVGFDLGENDVSQLECTAQAGGGLYFGAGDAEELAAALENAIEVTPEKPAGLLSVKVVRNGALCDASVRVTAKGEAKPLTAMRTYERTETNPRSIPLPDGVYDVQVTPIGLSAVPAQSLGDVAIKTGERVEREVDFSTGTLRVGTTRNGKPTDATVTVFEAGSEREIAHIRTYEGSESNPGELEILPGTYDLAVKALKVSGAALQKLSAVRVEAGKTAERAIEFGSVGLSVRITRNGKLSDATVQVFGQDGKQVASSRTYAAATTNPKKFELPPGTYDVVAGAIEIASKPEHRWQGVQVGADSGELDHDFASGTLSIETRRGGALADCTVNVVAEGTNQAVASGRTYEDAKTNPKAFELPPGDYAVRVRPVKGQGDPQEIEVSIAAGQTVAKTASWPAK